MPLLSVSKGYGEAFKTPVVAAPSTKQLTLYRAVLSNNSGGTLSCAVAKKMAGTTNAFKVFQLIAGNTPDATDITSAIIAGTAATPIFTTTINDGYMIQCPNLFNVIGMTVTQAQTGAPVYTYEYWNGSAYTTLTTIAVPASYAAGRNLVVFQAPSDWVAGSSAAVGGNLTGYFSIIVRATTASGQQVQVGAGGTEPSMWLGQFIEFAQVPTAGTLVYQSPTSTEPLIFDSGEGIIPYFSGSPNAANEMSAIYEVSG